MSMSIWPIRKPVPWLALFLVLCVVGLVSFKQLQVTQSRNIDIPIVTISVAQPGAAPSEISTQIIQPIEDEISDITGVKHISATATDAAASITIEFALETNTYRALNDVKDAVAGVRSDLPESISEPVIKRHDVTGLPVLTYTVTDPARSIDALSCFIDEVVARDLQTSNGAERSLALAVRTGRSRSSVTLTGFWFSASRPSSSCNILVSR